MVKSGKFKPYQKMKVQFSKCYKVNIISYIWWWNLKYQLFSHVLLLKESDHLIPVQEQHVVMKFLVAD